MKPILIGLCFALLLGCNDTRPPTGQNSVTAKRPATDADPRDADRDNTAVNVRDRDRVTKTPIDQDENKDDVRITADIRKRVVDTKMSIDAQNVKIITQDGRVTLRGPVKSADERESIEKFATEVAGAGNVTNEIEVSRN